jgi:hypothetical protein
MNLEAPLPERISSRDGHDDITNLAELHDESASLPMGAPLQGDIIA